MAPNVLNREFAADAPNQKWVIDYDGVLTCLQPGQQLLVHSAQGLNPVQYPAQALAACILSGQSNFRGPVH